MLVLIHSEDQRMFGRKRMGEGLKKRRPAVLSGPDWSAQANATQCAFRSYARLIDPGVNEDSTKEMAEIGQKLEDDGRWLKEDEWRIMTWMTAIIEVDPEQEDSRRYKVSVECDGQKLSCGCPTLQRAFIFYKLYAHIIVYQFYGLGAPWMG